MKNYKIAINGFSGRMGQSIYDLAKELTFDVTVGVDLKEKISIDDDIHLTDNLAECSEMFDVVIDFTLPSPSINTVKQCELLYKPITIGTTGFNDDQKQVLSKCSKKIPILLAPNMSVGVNAMLRSISDISRLLSSYSVSIEETHHKNKVDSPSGTALKIADVVTETRGTNFDTIDIKSFREEGEIGTHKTTFKSDDDEIIIYHNAFNRRIFAKGALETSQWISEQKPGLYTYKDYMDNIS